MQLLAPQLAFPEGSKGAGDPADLPLELLEHELCQLAAHLEAGMARWIALLAEYDRRDGWWSWHGVRSVAEWIAWRCSVSPRAAREHVRVARALRELPMIAGAFSRGELSYSKVRPLTRVATERTETDLIELARHATAAQLERMLRGYERVTREEANASQEERELWWHWDSDGSLVIRGRLPAEQGMEFLRALETSRSQIRAVARAEDEEGGSAEPREDDSSTETDPPLVDSPPTNADALCRIAESYLARGPTPVKGADRHHVIVHVDADALSRDGPGRSRLADGPAIAPEVARRLGCDASLSAIVKRGRKMLSVGRRTRAIPAAIDRALRERDQGCRFPGCEKTRFVDAHHIRHWAQGGETSLDNLVLLCRHHHRLVHEGGFSVRRESRRFVFRDQRGGRLDPAPQLPPSDHAELLRHNRLVGLEIGADTLLTGSGEKMHLPSAVDAVLAICDNVQS
jgi:hypothetical protein